VSDVGIEVSPLQGTTKGVRVRLAGRIDEASSAALGTRMKQLRQEGFIQFALELSGVDYVNSGGVSTISDFADELGPVNGELVLVNPHQKV